MQCPSQESQGRHFSHLSIWQAFFTPVYLTAEPNSIDFYFLIFCTLEALAFGAFIMETVPFQIASSFLGLVNDYLASVPLYASQPIQSLEPNHLLYLTPTPQANIPSALNLPRACQTSRDYSCGQIFKLSNFFCFLFLSFQDHTHGIWKILGQGSNQSYSHQPIPQPQLDLSCVCDLHHRSWQCWIVNPLSEARDQTRILMDTSQVQFC